MNRRTALALLVSLITSPASAATRLDTWAQPMALDGVKNLHRVTPQLYRGAQPSAQGFQALAKKLAIQTVINLHDEEPDDLLAKGTGITCVHVPMNSFRVFSGKGKKLLEALHEIHIGLVRGPTFVHCVHGKDRTGGVMAAWRMVEQDWTAEAAIREMKDGGYGYSGWLFSNGRYLRKLDVTALQKQLNAM
jgi:tyrosine-protein phosphatase SIW14